MFTFSRRVMLIFVLAGVLFGCGVEEELLTVGEAIEGDYRVGYYDRINEKYIQIGTLNIENGEYVFTPQNGADTSYMVDRFYFISNPEGQYELIYWEMVNSEDMFVESEDLSIIATISFQGSEFNGSLIYPLNLNFLIRYNIKSDSIYFHSTVSEFQTWGVHKIE